LAALAQAESAVKPVPFGKYYLLERVNVGGMAEVFKAKAFGVEGFERLFAVKKILPSIAADEEFIRMFVDEAKIAVQLNHANIAQIFDLGKVDGAYFIALEYVSGKDLRTIYEHCRKVSKQWAIQQACYVVMQICEGLDYAHNKRDSNGSDLHLVHRDISPQNVLISHEGEVKLIDFGIAKAAGRASKTQAGILKGKFGYMSPEQVRGLSLDRRSDIFSLGILLFELLTMERLFYAESDFSTLEKIRNVELKRPRDYNPEVPEALEAIVLKALSRDPNDRFANAAELHEALQGFLFSSGLLYTRKDLAAYMHTEFADAIAREQAKLEEYRELLPPPASHSQSNPRQATPPPPPPPRHRASPSGGHPAASPPPLWSHPQQPAGGQPSGPYASAPPLGGPGQSPFGPPGANLGTSGPPSQPGLHSLTPGAAGWSWSGPPNIPLSTGSFAAVPQPRPTPAEHEAELAWIDDEAETTVYGKGGDSDELQIDFDPDEDIVYTDSHRALPEPPPLPRPPSRPAPTAATSGERSSGSTRLLVVAFTVLALLGAAVIAYLVRGLLSGSASVQLTALPPGQVEVLVDGELLHTGVTPIRIKDLVAGHHELVVRRKGFVDGVQGFDLLRGEVRPLVVRLRPSPTARGALRLTSEPPGAAVELDGEARSGRTPLLLEDLQPGPHKLTLRKKGYRLWEESVTVQPASETRRHAALEPSGVTLQLTAAPQRAHYTLTVLPDGDPSSGRTPAKLEDLPRNGEIELRVEQTGYQVHSKRYPLKPEEGGGDLVKLHVELLRTVASRPQPRPPRRTPRTPRTGTRRRPRPVKPPVSPPPERSKPEPPKAPGTLTVWAIPNGRLLVDGRDLGWTPKLNLPLTAGRHSVVLINEQFGARKTYSVTIQPGKLSVLKKKDWHK